MSLRTAATRAELLRTRRALERVEKGIALTRRKREALVAELLRAAIPAVARWEQLAEASDVAAEALLAAVSAHGISAIDAMGRPGGDIAITLVPATIWGLPVSDVQAVQAPDASSTARQRAPSLTGPAAAEAGRRYARFAGLLVEAAPLEQRLRRLGDAVAETSRRLRALEQRLAPTLQQRASRIREALDEREREEHVRLRHVRRVLHARRDHGETSPPSTPT